MRLTLRDVAPLHKGTLAPFQPRRWAPAGGGEGTSRRRFLQATMVAGSGLGLAALGLFPLGRVARAQHGSWSIKQNCNDLTYAQNDDCDGCDLDDSPACCCASGGFYDGTTCNRKHRPDECYAGTYDGWKWMTGLCCVTGCSGGTCSCRKDREWRCSDGWKRNNCDNPYSRDTDLRICRYVTLQGSGCQCV